MAQGPKWQHYTPNKKFYISTSDVIFSGWETMVFAVDENGEIDYTDLESKRYSNENEAYLGHLEIYDKWQYIHIVKETA